MLSDFNILSLWDSEVNLHLEEASTHKMQNHAVIFVPCDLLPPDPKLNGFLELLVEHFLCQVWLTKVYDQL